MSALYNSMYMTRWALFLLRWTMRCFYSVLQFLSKPGSRVIVPLGLAAFMYVQRAGLHAFLSSILDPYTDYTTQPWMLDTLLVMLLLLLAVAYMAVSRVLALTIGAFPQMARPLAPQRRFVATKPHSESVPVRMVVPALPPREVVEKVVPGDEAATPHAVA